MSHGRSLKPVELIPMEELKAEFTRAEREHILDIHRRIKRLTLLIEENERVKGNREHGRRGERKALRWVLLEIGAAEEIGEPGEDDDE